LVIIDLEMVDLLLIDDLRLVIVDVDSSQSSITKSTINNESRIKDRQI